jgi:uncharacterized protein
MMDLRTYQADLAHLASFEVVLYGSVLTDRFTARSDIDVAIVTRDPDRERNKTVWLRHLGSAPDRYDLRIFELLPLPVQHDIVEHHEVLFGDRLELSEYFYGVRRRWKDVRHRLEANRFTDLDEKRKALERSRPR